MMLANRLLLNVRAGGRLGRDAHQGQQLLREAGVQAVQSHRWSCHSQVSLPCRTGAQVSPCTNRDPWAPTHLVLPPEGAALGRNFEENPVISEGADNRAFPPPTVFPTTGGPLALP